MEVWFSMAHGHGCPSSIENILLCEVEPHPATPVAQTVVADRVLCTSPVSAGRLSAVIGIPIHRQGQTIRQVYQIRPLGRKPGIRHSCPPRKIPDGRSVRTPLETPAGGLVFHGVG